MITSVRRFFSRLIRVISQLNSNVKGYFSTEPQRKLLNSKIKGHFPTEPQDKRAISPPSPNIKSNVSTEPQHTGPFPH